MDKTSEKERMGEIIEAVMKVARGDYSVQVELSGENDEFDSLAMGLNIMIDDIRTSMEHLDGQRKELSALNEHLQQHIAERKRIEQMKDDFVSLASHELRTPLTSIVGYVDLILGEDVGKINKEQKEFLEIISQNAQRLEALINDVLDIEKIESGRIKLKREKVNLIELVEASVSTFKVMAENKNLKLEKEIKAPELEVLGDSNRLSQVLSNLLSNAIRYTKEGRVKVTAQAKGRFASVTVEDTGLGMRQEDLRNIFSRFFRSEDSYVKKTTGSGLGLSIAKATIERHNGDMKVESKLGIGSKFEVILPLLKKTEKV